MTEHVLHKDGVTVLIDGDMLNTPLTTDVVEAVIVLTPVVIVTVAGFGEMLTNLLLS